MFVQSPIFKPFITFSKAPQSALELETLVSQIGSDVVLPDGQRNYSFFNQGRVNKIVAYKEAGAIAVAKFLEKTDDEKQVTEGIYILDRMIDAGVKDIFKTYPVISKFNYTKSPNIQVMLAGVYRKTQVPDAFGPLMTMFLKNSQSLVTKPFDPNEEIGGAILEYLRNKTSVSDYAKTQGH